MRWISKGNMKAVLTILAISASLVCSVKAEDAEIPEEFMPIQQHIYDSLIAPEDGEVTRDIKSLFAQYILLAAMDKANATEQSTTQTAAATPALAQQPQEPQVIYVYVTPPPTDAARGENIKTKKTKPTKPPKTKKPKPPKAPHPDLHVEQAEPQKLLTEQPAVVEADVQPPATSPPVLVPVVPSTSVPILQPAAEPAPAPALPQVPQVPATSAPQLPTLPPVTLRPRPSTDHVLNQVDKILANVGKGNITGIVDQSLQINTSKPVQNLVTGILNTIFCTPINRLLGRCRG